jgi:hypothetical protein
MHEMCMSIPQGHQGGFFLFGAPMERSCSHIKGRFRMLSINGLVETLKSTYKNIGVLTDVRGDISEYAARFDMVIMAHGVSEKGLNEAPTKLLPEDCDQIDPQLTRRACEIIAGTADISECVGVVVIEQQIYCVLVHKTSPVILFEQVRVSPRVLN